MKKRILNIAVLAILTIGQMDALWAQVRCLSMTEPAQASCCCAPASGESHCPMPQDKSECPMFTELAISHDAVEPLKFVPHLDLLVLRDLVVEAVQPRYSFEKFHSVLQTLHQRHLQNASPPTRAPPATPVAA